MSSRKINYIDIKKANARETLLAYLNAREPRLIRFLANTWHGQRNAITYKEIAEAIERGDISPDWFDMWRQDYSQLVADHLLPEWIRMAEKSHERFMSLTAGAYDPGFDVLMDWTTTRAANLVVNITQQQTEAIRGLVVRAAALEHQAPMDLAKVIRPTIGLYPQQAVANLNYYNKLRENFINMGEKERKATERAKKAAECYAQRQERYRASMIARTELATAHNKATDGFIKQAIQDGYLPNTEVKMWVSARDDRVCDTCKELHGTIVPINELFPGGFDLPPCHPNCRCAVNYYNSREEALEDLASIK